MIIDPGFESDAVPKILIVDWDKLAPLVGLVIDSVGAPVSIFIVLEAVVSKFPTVSFDLYLI